MLIDKYTKLLSERGYEVYRPSATLAFALKSKYEHYCAECDKLLCTTSSEHETMTCKNKNCRYRGATSPKVQHIILYVTPFHLFRINWEHVNYRARMNELRDMIRNNEIKDVVDLTEFCSPIPGKKSKMYGLPMTHTKIEYYTGEWA